MLGRSRLWMNRTLKFFSYGPERSATLASLLRSASQPQITHSTRFACLYRACRDAQGGPLTFHLSPIPCPFSRLTAALVAQKLGRLYNTMNRTAHCRALSDV